MIIAIDGLSGTGKTSVAADVARELGIRCMDTGAMFRAYGLKALHELGDIGDADAVVDAARRAKVSFEYEAGNPHPVRVLCDGEDFTAAIRTSDGDHASSVTSTYPGIRELVLELEHEIGDSGDYVVEGRDIGTVVFPEAEAKFFFTASIAEKARRRAKQNSERGVGETDPDVLAWQMAERDERDSTRKAAPCLPADDAMVIDTNQLTQAEVAAIVVAAVLAKRDGAGDKTTA